MKYILPLLLIFAFPLSSFSQWVQLGPGTGDVDCLERVGGNIWVGTEQGIYISTDEGVTWAKNAQFGTGRYILLDRVGTSIYTFGTYTPIGQNGLYRSTDEGQTWELVSQSLGIGSTFLADQVDIIECSSHLFFRSSGKIFSAEIGVWEWEEEVDITALQAFSTFRSEGETLVVSGASFISISTDCGETWNERVPQEVATFVQLIRGDTLYAMRRSLGEYWASYDLGVNWVQLNHVDLLFQDKIIQLADGTYIEIGINVFFTPRLDTAWTNIPSAEYLWIEDALLLNNGEILLSGDVGLLRVNVERTSVTPDDLGPPTQDISQVFANKRGMFIASTPDGNIWSNDGGYRWAAVALPTERPFIRQDAIHGAQWIHDTLFAIVNNWTAQVKPPYVETWTFGSYGSDRPRSIVVADDIIYLMTSSTLYRSVDRGESVDSFLSLPLEILYEGLAESQGYLYARTISNEVYRYSIEEGGVFERLETPGLNHTILETVIFSYTDTQWSSSIDGGDTWVDLDMSRLSFLRDGQGAYATPRAAVASEDSIYVTPSDGRGVYASGDQGFTWVERTFNLSRDNILTLAYDPYRKSILAGVDGRSLFGYYPVGIINSTETAAIDHSLEVYPNPATSAVNINFPTFLPSNAELFLFSANGQQLSPYLVNRTNEKALLVVEHLPEGLYYVAVQIGKEVVTTPVVVAR